MDGEGERVGRERKTGRIGKPGRLQKEVGRIGKTEKLEKVKPTWKVQRVETGRTLIGRRLYLVS